MRSVCPGPSHSRAERSPWARYGPGVHEFANYKRYLVVDLEATTSPDGSLPEDEREIIEIGAVAIDPRSFRQTGRFESFVKPQLHPLIGAFTSELTGIRQSDIDSAPGFAQALEQLVAWLGGTDQLLLCSWGYWDAVQLRRDCARHDLAYPFSDNHLDLQQRFVRQRGMRPRDDLLRVFEKVGMKWEGAHHRALSDAANTARLLPLVVKRK